MPQNSLISINPPSRRLLDSWQLWQKRLSGCSIIVSFVLCILSVSYGFEELISSGLNTHAIVWLSIGLSAFCYCLIRMVKIDSLKRDLGALFPEKLKQFLRSSVAKNGRYEEPFYPEFRIPNLPGYWFPSSDKGKATVILIGGNTPNYIQSHHMDYWVRYYRQKDMNVLLLDVPKYGLAYHDAPSTCNDEVIAYQTTCEAHRFALQQGVSKDRIIIHGFSQGGPMAAHLAALCPETSTLVLDHTYFRIEDVMSKLSWQPKCSFKLLNRASYDQYQLNYNGNSIKTSAWNTSYALKRISRNTLVFVIQGIDDRNMPSSQNLSKIRPDLTYYRTQGGHLAQIDERGEKLFENFVVRRKLNVF